MNREKFRTMLKQEDGRIRLPKWEVTNTIERKENTQSRYLKSIPPKYRIKFPDECPAFLLLDANGFAFDGDVTAQVGEIVEGTFNDQGNDQGGRGLMLGFARPEGSRVYFFEMSAELGWWRGAWHYTGHVIPLTQAARDMLAVAGFSETTNTFAFKLK